jgi:hypothetical protein
VLKSGWAYRSLWSRLRNVLQIQIDFSKPRAEQAVLRLFQQPAS